MHKGAKPQGSVSIAGASLDVAGRSRRHRGGGCENKPPGLQMKADQSGGRVRSRCVSLRLFKCWLTPPLVVPNHAQGLRLSLLGVCVGTTRRELFSAVRCVQSRPRATAPLHAAVFYVAVESLIFKSQSEYELQKPAKDISTCILLHVRVERKNQSYRSLIIRRSRQIWGSHKVGTEAAGSSEDVRHPPHRKQRASRNQSAKTRQPK